jgi:periplasmic protein TonB
MLHVLLESRAPRTRRVRSTIASALLHAGLIAGAVALTMPDPVDGRPAPTAIDPIRFVRTPLHPPAAPTAPRQGVSVPTESNMLRTIPAPDLVPTTLTQIDVGPAIAPDELVIGPTGVRTASPISMSGGALSGTASVMDERLVDRAPRLAGRAIEPLYPASLRQAGIQGRVVVQFVVDTLGRAELGELQVVETPHPQFVEPVRAALARYRFTAGEAAGRKVRTRVQMPFEFTLVR